MAWVGIISRATCWSFGESTFGSVVGVVHDKTDAVVPGANVQIKDLADNSTRSATSDQNGSFEFVNLKPSRYEVTIHADGFTDFRVPSAELTARQALRVDVTLNVKSLNFHRGKNRENDTRIPYDWVGESEEEVSLIGVSSASGRAFTNGF